MAFYWSAVVAEPSWRAAVQGGTLPSLTEVSLLAFYLQYLRNSFAFR